MGRYATNKGGGDFQQAPAGTHIARCFKLIDLGTQRGEFQGKVTHKNQVLVQWELPNELMEADGEHEARPFIVSKFYTNSLHEKSKMRPDLEAWRGKPFTLEEEAQFDLQNILGKACMLSVIHKDDKAKISAVMALPKGQTCPPPINQPMAFWLDEFDQEVFDGLSDGLKDIIRKSPEYQAATAPPPPGTRTNGAADDSFADDIPF